MNRRTLLALLLLVAGSVLAGVIFGRGRRVEPGVSLENFRRLHVGMTEQRVIELLGKPESIVDRSMDRDSGSVDFVYNGHEITVGLTEGSMRYAYAFSEKAELLGKITQEPPWFERLKAWIGL